MAAFTDEEIYEFTLEGDEALLTELEHWIVDHDDLQATIEARHGYVVKYILIVCLHGNETAMLFRFDYPQAIIKQ